MTAALPDARHYGVSAVTTASVEASAMRTASLA